jgi:predicted amidohydrolase
MRVAAIQTTAGPDRQANLEAAAPLVEAAAAAGAALIVLPEYFSVAGGPDALRRGAEPVGGPTVTWASGLAARLGVHLVAGSFPEDGGGDPGGPGDRRLFNTSCLIGPDGAVIGVYRKIHLFDVGLAGAASHESATMTPGRALSVTDLGGATGPAAPDAPDGGGEVVVGLSLCYDLRFPEIYRIMTLRGATVIAAPSAFTATTGPAHWRVLLRARAIENQVYMIGAGQEGRLPPGMPACHGHSLIVDPWGTVLAERTDPGPGFVVADLDLAGQRRIRDELPVLANRRPEAYLWPDEKPGGNVQPSG